ncbi:MAG: hypothetical protein AB1894_07410 [Chloroflexota bacterium]
MSENDILRERAIRVENAFRLLQGNKDSLGNIPGILRQLITLRVWEGYDWHGAVVSFGSFREFVETPPPEGLGVTVDELIGLCRKYPEIAEQLDITVQEQMPSYRPPKNRVGLSGHKRPSGTSFRRNLRRLRSLANENPAAAAVRDRVLRGELSANRALRELGVRKSRYGIEATPESVINFVKKHLTPDEISRVLDELGTQ